MKSKGAPAAAAAESDLPPGTVVVFKPTPGEAPGPPGVVLRWDSLGRFYREESARRAAADLAALPDLPCGIDPAWRLPVVRFVNPRWPCGVVDMAINADALRPAPGLPAAN